VSLVVEQSASRGGRWLRDRRLRIAFWIAVVEAVLVVFDVLSWWLVLLLFAGAVVAYFAVGRQSRSGALRQSTWIAAVSQGFVVLVPAAVAIVGTIFLVALAILAVVALVILLTDRR
jgi:hypothetical protein